MITRISEKFTRPVSQNLPLANEAFFLHFKIRLVVRFCTFCQLFSFLDFSLQIFTKPSEKRYVFGSSINFLTSHATDKRITCEAVSLYTFECFRFCFRLKIQ